MTDALKVTTKLNTGAEIPLVGLGTVPETDDSAFKKAVRAAIVDAGYKHIDTAWYYGTEPAIGDELEDIFKTTDIKREDVFITTKVWPCFWNDPEESIKLSLKDLKVDYVDLLLQHWPVCFKKVEDKDGKRVAVPRDNDGNLLYDESGDYLITYKKLLELKNLGKAKAIGVSNYTIEMLDRIIKETGVVPATNQVELHPHLPQVELQKFCKSKGIVLEAYSPFGSGGAPNLKIPVVEKLASKYNSTPAEIIVNYFIGNGIVALPRSSNVDRLKKGYKLVKLTSEDLNELTKFGEENPKRYITDEWGKSLGFEHWD